MALGYHPAYGPIVVARPMAGTARSYLIVAACQRGDRLVERHVPFDKRRQRLDKCVGIAAR